MRHYVNFIFIFVQIWWLNVAERILQCRLTTVRCHWTRFGSLELYMVTGLYEVTGP